MSKLLILSLFLFVGFLIILALAAWAIVKGHKRSETQGNSSGCLWGCGMAAVVLTLGGAALLGLVIFGAIYLGSRVIDYARHDLYRDNASYDQRPIDTTGRRQVELRVRTRGDVGPALFECLSEFGEIESSTVARPADPATPDQHTFHMWVRESDVADLRARVEAALGQLRARSPAQAHIELEALDPIF